MDYWGGGGGGGGQRVSWPPLSSYWGGLAPPGPPSSNAYAPSGINTIFEQENPINKDSNFSAAC